MSSFFEKHPKLGAKKELIYEILRFLLVGVIATGVDYLFYILGSYLLFRSMDTTWCTILSTALGFVAGNFVNFGLSIVFVFKGAKEDKKTHSFMSFLIFTIIGIIGLFIKMGVQTGGNYLLLTLAFPELEKGMFWYWFIDTFVYCVATLIVLIWNYVGRKLLIFKNTGKKEEVKEEDNNGEE